METTQALKNYDFETVRHIQQLIYKKFHEYCWLKERVCHDSDFQAATGACEALMDLEAELFQSIGISNQTQN